METQETQNQDIKTVLLEVLTQDKDLMREFIIANKETILEFMREAVVHDNDFKMRIQKTIHDAIQGGLYRG